MFNKYQHIERVGTDEVEGIEEGNVYVFPKVDGTNGCVWLEDGEIHCGSRNREVTLDNDNQGFMAHIMDNKDKYEAFFKKFPEYILYGEFLVKHTISWYRDNAFRKFYVFDVVKAEGEKRDYMHYEDYRTVLNDCDIEFVPPLGCWEFPNDEIYQKLLLTNKYLIDDDEERLGEGIVLKRYGYVNKYGHTKWAKIVRGEFKEHHKKIGMNKTQILESGAIEKKICEKYITKEFVLKEKAKLDGPWTSKRIPELLSRVFHELVTEETWHFVKEHKYPVIDFKMLNRFCTARVKDILGI